MMDKLNARSARRTRAQLIAEERKRQHDHEQRLHGLRAELDRVAAPIRALQEAEQRVNELSIQIDQAMAMNGEARRDFQTALEAAADPRLLRLREDVRRALRRCEGATTAEGLRLALSLAMWREATDAAIGNPEIDDDAISDLIVQGTKLVSAAKPIAATPKPKDTAVTDAAQPAPVLR